MICFFISQFLFSVEEGWRYKETFDLQVGQATVSTRSHHVEMDEKLGAFYFALGRSTLFGGTLDRSTVLYLIRFLPVFSSFDGQVLYKDTVQLDSELLMKSADTAWKPNRHFLANELIFISGFCKRDNEQVLTDGNNDYVKCEVAGIPNAVWRKPLNLVVTDAAVYRNFFYMYGALPNIWPTCHLIGRYNMHPQFLAEHMRRCFPSGGFDRSILSAGNGYSRVLAPHIALSEIDQERDRACQDLARWFGSSGTVDDVERFTHEYDKIIGEARAAILNKTDAANKYTCAELLIVDLMHDQRIRTILRERINAIGDICGKEYAKSRFPYLNMLCSFASERSALTAISQSINSCTPAGLVVLMRGSRLPCGACAPMLVRECETGGIFSELIGRNPVKLSVSSKNIYERKPLMVPYSDLCRSTPAPDEVGRDTFRLDGSPNMASFSVYNQEPPDTYRFAAHQKLGTILRQ